MKHSTRSTWLAVALAAVATAPVASAQAAAQPQPNDPQLAQHLSKVEGMTRSAIDLAELGQKHAQSKDARSLAKGVAKDYQEVLRQLESLAKSRGVTLEKTAQDPDTQRALAELQGLKGADFDRRFIETEVTSFEKMEQSMKDLRAATPGQDAKVKEWLDKTENKVERSLEQARAAKKHLASAK